VRAKQFKPLLFAPLVLCTQTLFAQTSSQPRDWDATLRLFAVQDSNVPLAANGSGFSGSTSSPTLGVAFNGSKDLLSQNRGWYLAINGGLTQSRQSESSLQDFDMASLAVGIAASRNMQLGSMPSKLAVGYQFSQSWLGGSAFQSGHNINSSLTADVSSQLKVGFFAGFFESNFSDDGTQPDLTSRDSTGNSFGIRADYGFNNNRQAVHASWGRQKIRASGANFDVDGDTLSVGVRSYLVFPWVAMVNASRASSDYVTYNSVPQRTAKVDNVRLIVAGPISRSWSADVSWGASRYGSDLDAYRATRRQVTAGLGYTF
jgi:hypothetical protein